MKIAYLVLAHKNPEQVKRLVGLLNGDIYIHLDSKSNLESYYISNTKLHYIDERVSITWGGFTMIEATLKLINEAKQNCDYDYYILLSGDDYPIMKLDKLESYLTEYRKYSFVEYDKFEEKWKILMPRYQKFKIFQKDYLVYKAVQKVLNFFVNKRCMYKNMQAYKGSQWWCLNSESIEYILKYIKENKSVIRYFKHTHIPDEMFFQIILLNSHLKNTILNDNLRYILLDGPHPDTLTKNHLDELINAENKFFARKFDVNVDSEILDLLDNTM